MFLIIGEITREQHHLDWTLVPSPGPRFENLVAVHLLKWVAFQEDSEGRDLSFRYLRDIDGREVDFIVVEGRRPIRAIECKSSDEPPSKALRYFKQKFPECECLQITLESSREAVSPEGIRLSPALPFLRTLV